MTLRFLKTWGIYHKGSVTDQVGGGVADELIRRGFAERCEPKKSARNKMMSRERVMNR